VALLRKTNANVDFRDENPYQKAMREVASQIQIMIYRRGNTPIKGVEEVITDLGLRITEIAKENGSEGNRVKRLLELAAYSVYAAVSGNPQNGDQ
jgi:hypothetical protein